MNAMTKDERRALIKRCAENKRAVAEVRATLESMEKRPATERPLIDPVARECWHKVEELRHFLTTDVTMLEYGDGLELAARLQMLTDWSRELMA